MKKALLKLNLQHFAVNANYADKYKNELDQLWQEGAHTSIIETPSVDWLNAKSFRVQSINTTGYKPHTRNKGYNEGTVENTEEIYTLNFDRDVEFFVDKADVDETRQALSAANITREFTRNHAVPEMDAYRFSKLATYAQESRFGLSQTQTLTNSNVFSELKAGIRELRKFGPQNVIMWVSGETMDALERSTEFDRTITVSEGPHGLNTRVTSVDGVQLIEVFDGARFMDKYDFSDGFAPTEDAKSINFMAVVRPAVIAKAKFNSVYLHQPGSHTEGDGFLYQNRIYHDLFVMKNQEDRLVASFKTAAAGE